MLKMYTVEAFFLLLYDYSIARISMISVVFAKIYSVIGAKPARSLMLVNVLHPPYFVSSAHVLCRDI